MHPRYTEENINLNTLMDYVFQELTPSEENAMEDFLDGNEEYSDTVNGILNYCLKENIKTKEALENNLKTNKAAFFEKFPTIDPKNLKKISDPNKDDKSGNGKFFWLLLLLLVAVGVAFIFLKSQPKDDDSKKQQIEEQDTQDGKKTQRIDSLSNIQDSLQNINKEPQDSIQAPSDKNKTPQQQDPKDKIKVLRAQLTPQELERIGKEMETQEPLMAQANESWNKEFEILGNPPLEKAIQQLAAGDSTSYARYCVGLYELTKASPDLNKAIQLLSAVQQYEYPDVTWYLFRTYLLSGDLEQAKQTFKDMNSNPENKEYYQDNFLKNLPLTMTDLLK